MSKHFYNIVFLFTGVIIGYFLLPVELKIYFILSVFLIFSIRLTLGICIIRHNYFFKAQNTIASSKVLLTFDDGPDPNYTEKILEILKRHNIASIFFVIGHKISTCEVILLKAIKDGHLIGNHTFSHPNNFALLPTKSIVKEIEEGKKALKNIDGTEYTLFRTPIGVTNPHVARAIKRTKVKTIGWTLRTFDTNQQDKDQWIAKIVSKTKKGSIILLHDTQKNTADHLEEYIINAKKNGIEFVNRNDIKAFIYV